MNFGVKMAACQHCDHRWVAVFEENTESLQCPSCRGYTSLEDMQGIINPPLHLVVSRFDGATYLKVSRECDRLYLAGLLSEALAMVHSSNCETVSPQDCELQVMLTVEQPESSKEA